MFPSTSGFFDRFQSLTLASRKKRGSSTFLLSLALAMVLALAGCDMTGSDSESDKLDRTLDPGEIAETQSGARLMASVEALDEPVSISGKETENPMAETPLPEGARAPGPFYRISGDRTIDLSAKESPLYLALPVPDGVDPSHLALGVRVPSRYVTDTTPSSPEYGWDLLTSAYEPERNLLIVPTTFLLSDGIVLTVVEKSDYTSPSMEGTAGEGLFEKTKNFFDQERLAPQKSHGSGFKVKCRGFGGSGCGNNEKNDVQSYLQDVHDDYVSAFRSPDLKTPLLSNKYVWIIKKDGTAWCKGDTVGKYLSLTNKAITCYDGGSDPPSERITRHEFFHAIQYNYAPISWSKLPKQRPDWIIEATAALAADPNTGGSNHAIRNRKRPLRSVDAPLTSTTGNNEYQAQDFWTYVINRRSSTMAKILDPVFKQQSNAPNKPTAEKVNKLYSLPDDYWGWLRNQGFESQVTNGYGGKLSDRCIFDPNVASPNKISYDAGSRSEAKEEGVTVSKLSARVMAVQVQTGSNRIDLEITASTSDANSYVRIYPPHTSSTTDCWTNSEDASDTLADVMLESSQKTYYVLLSATMIDVQRSSFNINISHEDRPTK